MKRVVMRVEFLVMSGGVRFAQFFHYPLSLALSREGRGDVLTESIESISSGGVASYLFTLLSIHASPLPSRERARERG